MTEYYWVLQADMSGIPMYWHYDEYFTLLFRDEIAEEHLINAIKAITPKNVTYTEYTIREFDPENGHLPGTKKMLVIFEVSDGLTNVGPAWVGGGTPEKHLKGKVPTGYYHIGDPPTASSSTTNDPPPVDNRSTDD